MKKWRIVNKKGLRRSVLWLWSVDYDNAYINFLPNGDWNGINGITYDKVYFVVKVKDILSGFEVFASYGKISKDVENKKLTQAFRIIERIVNERGFETVCKESQEKYHHVIGKKDTPSTCLAKQ